jgi:hypothetical protein
MLMSELDQFGGDFSADPFLSFLSGGADMW